MTYFKNWSALVLVVVLALGMFISSCDKDVNHGGEDIFESKEKNSTEHISVEESIARSVEKAKNGTNFVVEHFTFEELNKLIVDHGLPPLDPGRFKRNPNARDYPCTNSVPCSSWIDHGDWNGNDTLSALDIFLAYDYLCESEAGCTGNLATDEDGIADEAIEFGFISVFCDGGEAFILNQEDLDSAVDYALGHPVCY